MVGGRGRHKGAGRQDPRHDGLGTIAHGSVIVTPDPATAVGDVVNPTVILSSIIVTPDPATAVGDVVNPTVVIGNVGVIHVWARVNGVDVSNTSAIKKVVKNDVLTFIHEIEMEKDDYYELMFAVEDIGVYLNAIPISTIGPETPSVVLNVKKAKV